MKRENLEHVLRATSDITGERDIYVLGSQAILGTADERMLPEELTRSIEVDIAFSSDKDGTMADRIDGAIGELSPFHNSFGYYPHGVGIGAAMLPPGWRKRVAILETSDTGGARGLCLEPHDLAASKLAAWREKDRDYVRILIAARLISRRTLVSRVRALRRISNPKKEMMVDWILSQPA